MVNPTHTYPPTTEPGPFNINRYARIGLHELSDGTFVNTSHGSPLPVFSHGEVFVHDGYAYHRDAYYASIDGGATINMLLRTPAINEVHLVAYSATVTGGPSILSLLENVTVSADGTLVAPYNLNRTSSNTSGVFISENPTVSGGILIERHLIPAGHKDGGLSPNTSAGWVLKPSEEYCIRLTNNDSSAISASVEIMFYEEP